MDPHWVLSRTRLWADQSHRVERREHDSREALGRAHAGAVTLAKDATGEVGVAARWEVGNVSVGGQILEPNAGTKLEVVSSNAVGEPTHGLMMRGAAGEDAQRALVVDEVDRIGVAEDLGSVQ